MPAQSYAIPNDKLALYLLNPNHKSGGPKARFFLARGFSKDQLPAFAAALFHHAKTHWPGIVFPEPWGNLYEVIGPMNCPDGTTQRVLAVWKIETGQVVASFVTAYPFRLGTPHP